MKKYHILNSKKAHCNGVLSFLKYHLNMKFQKNPLTGQVVFSSKQSSSGNFFMQTVDQARGFRIRTLIQTTHCYVTHHRLENRYVLRHISNMNFHSWAVLYSRGCKEKKIQTSISMLLLRPVFFYVFMGKFIFSFCKYPSVRSEKLHDMKL